MAGSSILINVGANTGDAVRGLDRVQKELNNLQRTAKESQDSLAKFDKSLSNLGKAAASVGGLYAVTSAITDVTRAASSLQESTGSVRAVFGDAADEALRLSENSTKIGLSQSEYNQYAAQLASLLRNQGVAQEDLLSTTSEQIALASDLAATYGGPVSDAIDAIGAAYRGEFEQAEKYGITIKESAVKQEMAIEGVNRAQAVQNLLFEQAGPALGQWNREQDNYAVKSQIMRAEIEDAKARIGQGLLPVMSSAASVAADLASAMGKIPAPVYTVAIAVGALVVAKKLLTVAVARATAGLAAYQAKAVTAAGSTTLLGRAAGTAATNMGKIGAAVGVGTAAFIGWDQAAGGASDSLRKQVPTVDAITESLTKQGGSIRGLTIDLSNWAGATPLIDDQIESWSALEEIFNQTGWEKGKNVLGEIFSLGKGEGTVERTAAVEWLNNTKEAIKQISQTDPTRARELLDELVQSMKDAGASTEEINAVQREFAPVLQKTETAADNHRLAIDEMTKSYQETKKAVDEARDAVLSLTDPFFRQQNATSEFIATLQELASGAVFTSEAIDVATGSFNLNTEAGRKAQEAAQGLTTDTFELVAAMAANGASTDEMRAKVQQARDAFIAQAIQMGLTQAQAQALADQYGLVPDRVDTYFNVDSAEAVRRTTALKELLDAIQSKSVTIDIYQNVYGPGGSLDTIEGNLGGRPRRVNEEAMAILRMTRAGADGREGQPIPLRNRGIGQVKPKQRLAVNVMIDGKDIPARVVSTDRDPYWSPNLAGVPR